jgi:branched-chain amino acid transport system permease protein
MNFSWRKLVQYGLITGIAIWYVSLVGMVEAFNDRDVIDGLLSLGLALLVIIAIGMGYFVAQKLAGGKAGPALVIGLVNGLVGGLMSALLVIIIETTSIRNVFVNASPALAEILTFSQESLAVGLLMLIAFVTAFSLVGAGISLLPRLGRQFVLAGLLAILIFGMLEELLSVILGRYDLADLVADLLFGKSGLSIQGAIAVFLVVGGIRVLWSTRASKTKARMSSLPSTQRRALRWIFIALGVIFMIILPQLVGSYISQILVLVGLFALMALGLNIEIGLAGLLDLGFVGFFAIGAYVVGLFTSTTDLGLASVVAGEATSESFSSFWLAIPVAVAVSGLAGVFLGIPVLRMRGDYLAIVTLGLAEIIRILVLSDFLRPVLGGAQGILSIPKPAIPYVVDTINSLPLVIRSVLFFFISEAGLIKDPQHFYYLIAICCVIVAVIAWRLQFARTGRNWIAMREDEDVAEAMGINLVASKLLAFGMGASFAGLAGAIFATQVGSIFPHSFGLLISINVVSIVVIGGAGSIPGVIVGALVLVGLPELLREFAEFRLLIYGGLLVVMMLVKPEGLWPSEVIKRELVEIDDGKLASEAL